MVKIEYLNYFHPILSSKKFLQSIPLFFIYVALKSNVLELNIRSCQILSVLTSVFPEYMVFHKNLACSFPFHVRTIPELPCVPTILTASLSPCCFLLLGLLSYKPVKSLHSLYSKSSLKRSPYFELI